MPMNSTERREARYQRRKQKRLEKKQQQYAECDDFDKVFTFDNLYQAYKKCCRGVGWKASTQRYSANALLNVNDTLRLLKEGKYKSRGFYEFDIVERGKPRHIQSVHISERVVQRCLCDNALVPMFGRSFIYDNGACMERKGIDFSARRLVCHLQHHYRKHGTDGYALVFDFSKYFDTIRHEPLKQIVDRVFNDPRIAGLVKQFIDDFGDVGLGLGSQISQVSALMYPNALDHYVKEVLRVKHYGRYMDRIPYTRKQRILAKVFGGNPKDMLRVGYYVKRQKDADCQTIARSQLLKAAIYSNGYGQGYYQARSERYNENAPQVADFQTVV